MQEATHSGMHEKTSMDTTKAEALIMSHWRSLPESMRGLDTRRRTRPAADPRLEDEEDDREGRPWVTNGRLLLRSFLTAFAGPDKVDRATTTGGEQQLQQREREQWKRVKDLLFWWLFLSEGPHACLAFLDDHRGGQGSARDAQPMLLEKEALFNTLGPALLWSEPFAEPNNCITASSEEAELSSWAFTQQNVTRVFARVRARVLQAADNELVATVLIESLGHIYHSEYSSPTTKAPLD